MGDQYVWTGAAGDFNAADAGNWEDVTTGQNPAPNPPGLNDTATIGSGAIVGGDLGVNQLDLNGTPQGISLSLLLAGPSTNLSAALVQTQGVVNVDTQATLAAGTLDVSGNGEVNVSVGGVLDMAAASGNSDNGLVGDSGGLTGILTVVGAGAVVDDLYTGFFIGGAGNGQVTVSAGGAMNIGLVDGTSGEASLTIAQMAASNSSLTVSGGGTTVTVHGTTTVGLGGTGSFNLAGGASASLGDGTNALLIGDGSGNQGQLTVTGGSQLTVNGFFGIGETATGSLTLNAGASATFEGTALNNSTVYLGAVGDQAGSTGTLLVTDAGTLLTVDGAFGVGYGGSGTLMVQNGAVLTQSFAGVPGYFGLFLGADSGAVGSLLITDGTVSAGDTLGVGGGGAGTVAVSGGGTLTVLSDTAGYGALDIAYRAGGSGSIAVSGAGSSLAVAGEMSVGEAGSGALTVTAGASVTDTAGADVAGITVGRDTGASGTLTVDGAGTTLTDAGYLSVGGNGAGTLDITNGGTVSCANLFLDRNTGPASAITLGGTGATLSVAQDFYMGLPGGSAATLALTTGQMTVGGDSDIASGTMSLAGGSFTSGLLLVEGGGTVSGHGSVTDTHTLVNEGTVSVGSGALAFHGGIVNYGTMTAAVGHLVLFQQVTGTGTLGVSGHGLLDLVGGAQATQTVQFAGVGTLDIGAPGFFSATIAGFAAGDTIDLARTAASSLNYSGGFLALSGGGKVLDRLHFSGSYTTANFSLAADGHGGSVVGFV